MSGRIIVVIGATGAQGLPVVKHLLASKDGNQSGWKVRALTRDTTHRRAKELSSLGVELVQGSFTDIKAIDKLFEGAYGAFVNTDTFTVGGAAEMQAAFNIWETAKRNHVRHFIWSGLDYALRLGNYDPTYRYAEHSNTKGRFSDFLSSQPSQADQPSGTIWTVLTTGPYMDMLSALFAPLNIREDGTRVFAFPLGDNDAIPLVALDDVGWWARYIFDRPIETSAKNLKIASQPSTGPEIVETFKKVTGLPAIFKSLSMDEYFGLMEGGELPVGKEAFGGPTWEQAFRSLFAIWRDKLQPRDMDWVRSVHPQTKSLEEWMKEEKYEGRAKHLLKNTEDRTTLVRRNEAKTSQL